MGAIWDFISGKSTDWDEVDAKNAEASRRAAERQAERERVRPKRTLENCSYIQVYCARCGEAPLGSASNTLIEKKIKLKQLQEIDRGCGIGNHIPEFVPD